MNRSPVRQSGSLWLLLLLLGCSADSPNGANPDASVSQSEMLLEVADSLYRQAEFELALAKLEAALEAAWQESDTASAARALTWRGLASYRLGDYADARLFGENALQLKHTAGLNASLSRSYNALGLLAWNEGRLNDALDLYENALTTGRDYGDALDVARASNNLALVESDLGDFKGALAHYREARAAFRLAGRPDLEARVLTNLGAAYTDIGDPVAGRAALREALAAYSKESDPVGEQNAYGQLGVAYAIGGEPGAALAYLDTALVKSRDLGLRQEEASNLELIAYVHANIGAHRLALHYFEQASVINDALGLRAEEGSSLRARAQIHEALGNPVLAQGMALRALAIHEEIGARGEALGDLLMLGELDAADPSPGQNPSYMERARRLADTIDVRSSRIAVALTTARIAGQEDDPQAVLEVIDEAADDIASAGFDAQWEAEFLAGQALSALGRRNEAIAAARRSVEALEGVRSSLFSRLLQATLGAERAETYGFLSAELAAAGRTVEAFEVLESSRTRILLQQLLTDEAYGDDSQLGADGLANREEILHRIDRLLASIEGREEIPVEERYEGIDIEVRELEDRLAAARLDYSAHLLAPGAAADRRLEVLGTNRPVLPELQEALEDDEALLAWMLSPRLHLFLVTADTILVLSPESTADGMTERIRIARELASDSNASTSIAADVLTGLHDLLIRPATASGLLGGIRRLILVPDGVLTYLPFAALIDSETGNYLVQDFELVDVPSARALAVLRTRSVATTALGRSSVAGLAPFPSELPASRDEIDGLPDRGTRELYIGDRATEAVLRDKLSQTRLVHVATHGVLNARNPLFSQLLMATGTGEAGDDGRLEVHELLSQTVRSDLVFLSGCDTGSGVAWALGVAGGQDYATLAQAFLYAGARNVLATLWPIRDNSAARFSVLFYEGLATHSPVTALARAQRAAIETEDMSELHVWATYRLTGDGMMSDDSQESASSPVKQM